MARVIRCPGRCHRGGAQRHRGQPDRGGVCDGVSGRRRRALCFEHRLCGGPGGAKPGRSRRGTGGQVSFFASTQTDLVVDVEGYTSASAAGGAGAGLYNALPSPVRICDTRAGNPSGLSSPNNQCNGMTLATNGILPVKVATINGIPAGATAAVFNVTVVNPQGAGFLTVFPQGSTQPFVSNLDYTVGQVTANRVIVPLSTSGATPGYISVYSSAAGRCRGRCLGLLHRSHRERESVQCRRCPGAHLRYQRWESFKPQRKCRSVQRHAARWYSIGTGERIGRGAKRSQGGGDQFDRCVTHSTHVPYRLSEFRSLFLSFLTSTRCPVTSGPTWLWLR